MMNEHLSAWIDGELDHVDAIRVADSLAGQPERKHACTLCWLIGDVLRGEPALSADFTRRVMDQLESEAVVLAPRPLLGLPEKHKEGWRWMPMAAAMAGVAVAGWMGLTVWNGASREAQVIALHAPAVVQVAVTTSPAARLLSNDQSYLMAHQASSMGVPMAGVAQYIRTVSDEHAAGAR